MKKRGGFRTENQRMRYTPAGVLELACAVCRKTFTGRHALKKLNDHFVKKHVNEEGKASDAGSQQA